MSNILPIGLIPIILCCLSGTRQLMADESSKFMVGNHSRNPTSDLLESSDVRPVKIDAVVTDGRHVKTVDFESDFISVSVRGSGDDIILMHGLASTSEVWSDVASRLESDFRVHLIDIAGFADRPAPRNTPDSYLTEIRDEVLRYIETNQIKSPISIGHSMGGLLSLMLGSKNPENIGQIIVVDALPFYSLLFNPDATTEQVSPIAANTETQFLAMGDAQFEAQARASLSIQMKSPEKVDLALEWSVASNRAAYAQMLREVMTYDGRKEIGKIDKPIIVMYAYDEAMPITASRLEQLYRDAYSSAKDVDFIRIDESFHFVMWDRPEKFFTVLIEAIQIS